MLCMEREDCIPTCSPSLRMGAMGDRASSLPHEEKSMGSLIVHARADACNWLDAGGMDQMRRGVVNDDTVSLSP
jgi:hypothetical protein